MADVTNQVINECIMRFARRAERVDREKLVATFVSTGPLFTILSTQDHQIIYGRRGTGKTHALQYLAESTASEGHVAIYVDMRTIGSDGSIYSDRSQSLAERATRLLIDVLTCFHDELFGLAVEKAEECDLSRTGPLLDELADAISQVRVVGDVSIEAHDGGTSAEEEGSSLSLVASAAGLTGELGLTGTARFERSSGIRRSQEGHERLTVHFGTVGRALGRVLERFPRRRFWLLLDEWSAMPLELQPYLADLFRRAVFPIIQVTVKIAAIEHRSRFQLYTEQHDYVGIEVGADAQANLNLDDFMVFDNDHVRAKAFFRDLLFKHFRASEGLASHDGPQSAYEFISQAFTQVTAFEEFVRAVEGLPRDAINIAEIAAQRAYENSISVPNIRSAARDWYQRDKSPTIQNTDQAFSLLNWIIDEVIAHRRARAFLLRVDQRHLIIDRLFDARLLHVLKKSVAAHDQPGVRYFVYKLDYGCYVDLINTARAPEGLLPLDGEEDGGFVDVPPDDYRSIRRAILDLDDFFRQNRDRATAIPGQMVLEQP